MKRKGSAEQYIRHVYTGIKKLTRKSGPGRDEHYFFWLQLTLFKFFLLYTYIAFIENYFLKTPLRCMPEIPNQEHFSAC